MMRKFYLFVLLLSIYPSRSYTQKQANSWHFGSQISLDFRSGNPVLSGSAIETFEGSASVCDSLGILLFYTNGGGREPLQSGQDGGHIWNQNNAVMYDMQGTEGGGFSAAQSAVIIEAPAEPNVYYVFTMEEIEFNVGASSAISTSQPLGRGLRYFKVDMNLNSGLGSVILADQPVYLPSYEGVCAIRHRNKRDYWILINQDSTGIGVYSVTPSGVAFSSSFNGVGGSTELIKASPDGTKFRIGNHLFDFDNNTGSISNPRNLNSFIGRYEFSPNSKYLYEIDDNLTIRRFDLLQTVLTLPGDSIGFINVGFGTTAGQMQLGPDGKIYYLISDLSQNTVSLNRINCPNSSAPSIQPAVIVFSGTFLGLPNFPAWIFKNEDSLLVSLGPDTLRLCDPGQSFTLDAQNPGSTFLWSDGSTSQTIVVNTPGLYSVTVNGPCGQGSDQIVVLPCAPSANACQVFEYTGAPQQWVVPAGVDSIRIKMWGAAGGGGPDPAGNAGGSGGYTEVVVPVVAGDILQIVVGGGGRAALGHTGGIGGYGGGGNGGSGNRIEIQAGSPLPVGGAGGGGGLSLVRMLGSITNILGIAGGGGGGALNRAGGAGGGLDAEFSVLNNQFNLHGFGGTQTAGGAPSSNTIAAHPVLGTAGAGQQGGTGATDLGGTADRTGGGGGGAGLYGGGGGGSQDGFFGVGSAGGGGSGFVCNSCPGLYGFTQTGGITGIPPNSSDPVFLDYPGTATGTSQQNGGDGLVQICLLESCITSTDSIRLTSCLNYTDPLGNTYDSSGVYNYTLISSIGCDSNIVLDLTILPATQSTISITACDSYTAGNGNTYFQDTSFSYTLLSAQGCDSIINLHLTINQTSIPNTVDVTTCNTYTAPWGTRYSSSGEYSDTTANASGCDSISVIRLTINRDPLVTLSVSSPDSCAGRAVSFSLSNEAQISGASWNFGDPESGPDNFSTELNPMHIYSRPGTFRLQCIFQLSCGSDTLSSVLRFYDCSRQADICDLYIPTAFSPNGDGANDLFRTGSNCPFEDYFLQIFNRWGESIFLSDKPQDTWAGTYQQNPCQMGVYIYTLRYRFQSGEVQYARGNVTLVR